jgi:hypothetical protein
MWAFCEITLHRLHVILGKITITDHKVVTKTEARPAFGPDWEVTVL